MVRLAVNLDAMLQRPVPRGTSLDPWLDDAVGAATLAESGGADAIAFRVGRRITAEEAEAIRRVRDTIATRVCLRVSDPSAAEAALDLEPARLAIEASARFFSCREPWSDVVREAHRRGVSVAAGATRGEAVAAMDESGAAAIELALGAGAWDGAESERAAAVAREFGLEVGGVADEVDFDTIADFVGIREISWIEVGTCLVTRAILVGMARATTELRYLVNRSRSLEPCSRATSPGARAS